MADAVKQAVKPEVTSPTNLMPPLDDDTIVEVVGNHEGDDEVIGQDAVVDEPSEVVAAADAAQRADDKPVDAPKPLTVEDLQKQVAALTDEMRKQQSAKDREVVGLRDQLQQREAQARQWQQEQAELARARQALAEQQVARQRATQEAEQARAKQELDEWLAKAPPEDVKAFRAAQQYLQENERREAGLREASGKDLAIQAMVKGIPGEVIQEAVEAAGGRYDVDVLSRHMDDYLSWEFARTIASKPSPRTLINAIKTGKIPARRGAPMPAPQNVQAPVPRPVQPVAPPQPAPERPAPPPVTPATTGKQPNDLVAQFNEAVRRGAGANELKRLRDAYSRQAGGDHTMWE